jgi:HD-GYP domain-containing protein (c-di-GMP phosphodiesterase class II)
MAPFIEMVGNHQENVDGSGYYRGLRGTNISLGARIIAVADRLDDLTHDAPGRPAVAVDDALQGIERDGRFDAGVVTVLQSALGKTTSAVEQAWPAGLTSREVEVLRLAARGLTRAQIGTQLRISESTARHHLEHIYSKTGTTTRVGATLFAIESGLLS